MTFRNQDTNHEQSRDKQIERQLDFYLSWRTPKDLSELSVLPLSDIYKQDLHRTSPNQALTGAWSLLS